jgi:ATP-dependent DNA ligase
LDAHGLPSFQPLQQRSAFSGHADTADADTALPAYYYIFDILYFDNYSLEGVALPDRQALLHEVVVPGHSIRIMTGLATPY